MRRVVAVRFSPDELALLRITAAAAGVSLSTHIRELAVTAARVDVAELELEAAQHESFRLAEEERRRDAEVRRREEEAKPDPLAPAPVAWWARDGEPVTYEQYRARRDGRAL